MKTILVVDDNQYYRSDIVEILGFEQYDVMEAENGLMGLEMMREYRPDLIVSDVNMPIMTGLEMLKAIKSDPRYATIPFIVFSGHDDQSTIKTATDLGANAYMTKPVRIAHLLAMITTLLNRHLAPVSRVSDKTGLYDQSANVHI